jgi:hypothetical protein
MIHVLVMASGEGYLELESPGFFNGEFLDVLECHVKEFLQDCDMFS